MNHARALMASAIASVLAACGGGGGDAPKASTPVSSASSSTAASAASSAATTASTPVAATTASTTSSPSLAAAKLAVEQSAAEAATARRAAVDAQALAAAERAAAETARRQAAAAAQQAAAADAQNKAAAEQAAQQAAERHAALTQKLAATEEEVKRAEGVVRAQAARLQSLEMQVAAAAKDEAQKEALSNANAEAPAIPECSGNALPVTDKATGLLLVCESQIVDGATKTEVGATKHASGRYYALPFPDKSMMVTGPAASYKLACGSSVCEWSKVDGSMDIVYAAVGKDGKPYRFESCREGEQNRLICRVPYTGLPDGVDASVDDREPQVPRVGAEITDTDTSGKNGFRAKAETSRPMRCPTGDANAAAFPWPNKDLFKQQENGTWKAVFDGGNCLGDVRVMTDNPEAPTRATFAASAAVWTLDVNGPDGKVLVNRGCSLQRAVEPDEVTSVAEALRADPAAGFGECLFGAAQAEAPVTGTQPEQQATPSQPQPEQQSQEQQQQGQDQQPAPQPEQQQQQQGQAQQTQPEADAAARARAEAERAEEERKRAEEAAKAEEERKRAEAAKVEAEAQQARERAAAEQARLAAEAENARAAEQARVTAEAAAAAQAQAQANANANASTNTNANANAGAQAQEQNGNAASAGGGTEPVSPDARAEGTETAANSGPVTSAGRFQQQTRTNAVDPVARSEGGDVFRLSDNGDTATYGGRQITTTVQPNGDITVRTSAGEVPFNKVMDANGNVLTEVLGCTEQNGDGPQECTFKAAS